MEKPTPHPFSDSNIALLGSDIDHHLRSFSASKEAAFHAAGIGSSAGLWIWRVEDFKLVAWPKERHRAGEFCEGDSYLVLNSIKTGSKDSKDQLIHNIFFWLGSKTSQDEAGVAAYKAVELDELLGGSPTQFREVESSESSQFLHLFHPQFTTLQGGHASGFNHVSLSHSSQISPPRLFQVTPFSPSSHSYTIRQIPISASLAHSEVYLADNGENLVQWNGRSSHPLQKAKAAEISRWWVDERDGRCHLTVVEDDSIGGDNDFWKLLGIDIAEVKLYEKEKFIPIEASKWKVITIKTDGGYEEIELPPDQVVQSVLETSSTYLITPENSKSQKPTYVWVGAQVEVEVKRSAVMNAQKALSKMEGHGGRKAIVKVAEGHEGKEFWKDIGK